MPPRRKPKLDPILPVPVESIRNAHRQIAERRRTHKIKHLQYHEKSAALGKRLADWEYRLAEWYAGEKTKRGDRSRVNFLELTTRARVSQTECRDPDWPEGRVFSRRDWNCLQRRGEFEEYVDMLRTSMVEAAKKKLEDHSLNFVDAHLKGLNWAVEESDYRQIYKYTTPALDRIAPVKQTPQITAVQIILSPQQQATIDTPLPVIEAEVVDD